MALNTPVVRVPLIPLPGSPSDPDMMRGGASREVLTLTNGWGSSAWQPTLQRKKMLSDMLRYCTRSRLFLLFVILHFTCPKETDAHKQSVAGIYDNRAHIIWPCVHPTLLPADGKVPLTRPDCLRVDGVQYTSAVLHWRLHNSTRRLNYVVHGE